MKIEEGSCVYVFYNPITKLTKIGITENISRRKCNLECACGCPIDIIYHSDHLLCASKYEMDALVKFNDMRTLGEWFNINPQEAKEFIENIVKNATRDPIVEKYKRGETITDLAKEHYVTRQAILARLKSYGIYDKNGKIYERNIDPVIDNKTRKIIIPKINTEIKEYDINNIKDTDEKPLLEKEKKHILPPAKTLLNEINYLDTEKPKLPLLKLRRIESNINYNDEWYQAYGYFKGKFITAYSKDINKIKQFIESLMIYV